MLHTKDAALLRQLRDDPQTGLSALLDTYGSLIRTLVGRVLRDAPQDAEEVTADVLVAAWRHAEELLRQNTSLKAWLCVTARNAAIDRWRTLRRSQTVPLDEELAGDWLLEPRPGEAEELVKSLVLALPEPDRTIFIRRYYLLEPSREIAARLHMQQSAVNTRLSRGRARLRQQFLDARKEETSHA